MEEFNLNSLKPIVLKTPLGFDYFDYEEVVMIEAMGNCSNIHTISRPDPVRVLHNLAFIEKKYCHATFFRCHKSYIINIYHIETLVLKTKEVRLKKSFVVPISEKYLRYIRKLSQGSM